MHIVQGDKPCWRIRQPKQVMGSGSAMLGRMSVVITCGAVTCSDQFGRNRNARFLQGLAIALQTISTRYGRRGARNISYSPVAEVSQVFRCEIAGDMIIHADAIHGQLTAVWTGYEIKCNDRKATQYQFSEMTEVKRRRTCDDATYAKIEKILRVLPLAGGIAKAVAQHDLEASGLSGDLDRASHCSVKWVGDRWHEKPNHRQEARLELTRRPIWLIAEALDRLLDPSNCFGTIRPGRPFSKLETVLTEVRAKLATSLIRGRSATLCVPISTISVLAAITPAYRKSHNALSIQGVS